METSKTDIFWEIHCGGGREGPGDEDSTRRAFQAIRHLPPAPRILDIGCGPGEQTVHLAKMSGGSVVGLDTHQPFLDQLQQRAAEAGLSERVNTIQASMLAMPFAERSLDLIWCEGAIYMMGFRSGLTAWRKFLVDGGYLAVTEPCWLKADVPDEVRAEWADYPAMTSIENTSAIIRECGYEEICHFVLSESAWWNYYGPQEKRLAVLRETYKDDPSALEAIARTQHEIDGYRKHAAYYGYVFFVMRKTRA